MSNVFPLKRAAQPLPAPPEDMFDTSTSRKVAKQVADKLGSSDTYPWKDLQVRLTATNARAVELGMLKGAVAELSAEDLAEKQARQFVWRGYIEMCRLKGVPTAIEYLQTIIDDALKGAHQP